jgi:hypothetical protein
LQDTVWAIPCREPVNAGNHLHGEAKAKMMRTTAPAHRATKDASP